MTPPPAGERGHDAMMTISPTVHLEHRGDPSVDDPDGDTNPLADPILVS